MNLVLSTKGKKFNSRMLADQIFNQISTEADLIIDFNAVEEVTPSFCHEMFVVLLDKNVKLKIVNANNSIKLQLNKALASIERRPAITH